MAEAGEMSVHELAPVIGMQRDDAPGVPAETGCQCSDHIDLCFRAYGSSLGPPGAPVGDCQCPGEVFHRQSSLMTYQVHAQDPGISSGGSMHVCTGILPPRAVFRVWEIPCRRYLFRSPARNLPMVAGLSWRRNLRVSSSTWRCPWTVRFSTKSAMPPAVSRPLTEIVQRLRLCCLPCLQICLSLDHRELHSHCLVLIPRTSSILSSFESPFA
jgi:hypothetical protein